jgi:hypothetical protein
VMYIIYVSFVAAQTQRYLPFSLLYHLRKTKGKYFCNLSIGGAQFLVQLPLQLKMAAQFVRRVVSSSVFKFIALWFRTLITISSISKMCRKYKCGIIVFKHRYVTSYHFPLVLVIFRVRLH